MGPEGPVSQKVGGRTGSRLSPKDNTSHGRRGKGLCVSACECRGGNVAREPCPVWGVSAIC